MNKPLRFQILEYLIQQDAVDHKIEIGAPFLMNDDSRENRLALCQALQYLNTERLIVLQGRPLDMISTQAGQFPSKYHTGLTASITREGEKYI